MSSLIYRTLCRQVSTLAKALLPRDLKADILDLPPRISVRALSFRLLCHAEFEEYFEARAQEISGLISTGWKSARRVSYPTICLLGFSGHEMRSPPSTVSRPPEKQKDWNDIVKVDTRIKRALSDYHYYVTKSNHGINEENLVRMLLPIGFDVELLDEAFLLEMNNFSVLRGEAAHRSVRGQVTKGVNPRDEYKAVTGLLESLKPIDAEFTRLIKLAGA